MAHDDDAQRDLEHKALRNVRGLVDKIQAEDAKGNQKQIVAVIVILLLVAFAVAMFLTARGKDAAKSDGPKIEIPPPSKPVQK